MERTVRYSSGECRVKERKARTFQHDTGDYFFCADCGQFLGYAPSPDLRPMVEGGITLATGYHRSGAIYEMGGRIRRALGEPWFLKNPAGTSGTLPSVAYSSRVLTVVPKDELPVIRVKCWGAVSVGYGQTRPCRVINEVIDPAA